MPSVVEQSNEVPRVASSNPTVRRYKKCFISAICFTSWSKQIADDDFLKKIDFAKFKDLFHIRKV